MNGKEILYYGKPLSEYSKEKLYEIIADLLRQQEEALERKHHELDTILGRPMGSRAK